MRYPIESAVVLAQLGLRETTSSVLSRELEIGRAKTILALLSLEREGYVRRERTAWRATEAGRDALGEIRPK